MNISPIPYIVLSIVVLAILVVIVFVLGKRRQEIPINKTMFASGLLIVGVAAALLMLDVIDSGVAAIIGMVGIGLIAASGRSKMKRIP